MGAFDDLLPAKPADAPPASAPTGAFGDLIPKKDVPGRDSALGRVDAAVRGLADTMTFGLADEFAAAADATLNPVLGTGKGGGSWRERYDANVGTERLVDKADEQNRFGYRLGGQLAGGVTQGLGLAKNGVTLMRPGLGLGQLVGRGAVEGAAYGGAYGAGNAEGSVGERLGGAEQGALSGAIIGGGVPIAARAIGAGISRAVTPLPVSAERQALAGALEAEGIPLTAGQRSGSTPLRYAESILGDAPFAGGPKASLMTAQGEAFTDAAMRRMGGAGRATPENMAANYERIGQQFEQLSARNTFQADQQLGRDLGTTLNEYARLLPTEQKRIVGELASDIVMRLREGSGKMPGADYQMIRSRLSRMANNARGTDGEFSDAIRGMRDALDNGMMRSVSPEDAGAWQQARREYGNWKDLSKAAGGAGENAAEGLISPQALRNSVATGRNREAYVRGEGDFADLARAGNAIMTPLPNSGTAQRNLIAGFAGSGGGAGVVGAVDPMTAAVVALGPSAFGRALWSGPVQKYLNNQVISDGARKAIESRLRAAIQGGAQGQSPRLSR